MKTAVRQILFSRPSWKPSDIPNPILWDSSRLDSLVLSASNVISWTDVYTGKVVAGGVSPTYSNGAVVFNGSQYLLGNDAGMPTGDFTAIILSTLTVDITVINDYKMLLSYGAQSGAGNAVFLGYARGDSQSGSPPNFSSFIISQYGDAIGISANHLSKETIGVLRRTNDNYVLNSFKSQAEFTASKVMQTNTALGGAFKLNIGCLNVNGAGSLFTGNIKKILIYPYVLSASDYDKAIGWAAWSSGVQNLLPSNHPYANKRP